MTLESFGNDLGPYGKPTGHNGNGIELTISIPGIRPVLKKRINSFEHKVARRVYPGPFCEVPRHSGIGIAAHP